MERAQMNECECMLWFSLFSVVFQMQRFLIMSQVINLDFAKATEIGYGDNNKHDCMLASGIFRATSSASRHLSHSLPKYVQHFTENIC